MRWINGRSLRSVALSAAGHVALILLAALVSGSSRQRPVPGGGDAITVEMVTLQSTEPAAAQQEEEMAEQPQPAEEPEEQIEEQVEEPEEQETEQSEEPEEQIEEPAEEQPAEEPDRQPEEVFSGVGASGQATGQVPGPATYESRVFGAIRRHFRTSITPSQSYRIVFTVNPDGSVAWEVIRTSGTAAFDRAVEHALAMANVPPPPPGRTTPTEIRIEFLGPNSD